MKKKNFKTKLIVASTITPALVTGILATTLSFYEPKTIESNLDNGLSFSSTTKSDASKNTGFRNFKSAYDLINKKNLTRTIKSYGTYRGFANTSARYLTTEVDTNTRNDSRTFIGSTLPINGSEFSTAYPGNSGLFEKGMKTLGLTVLDPFNENNEIERFEDNRESVLSNPDHPKFYDFMFDMFVNLVRSRKLWERESNNLVNEYKKSKNIKGNDLEIINKMIDDNDIANSTKTILELHKRLSIWLQNKSNPITKLLNKYTRDYEDHKKEIIKVLKQYTPINFAFLPKSPYFIRVPNLNLIEFDLNPIAWMQSFAYHYKLFDAGIIKTPFIDKVSFDREDDWFTSIGTWFKTQFNGEENRAMNSWFYSQINSKLPNGVSVDGQEWDKFYNKKTNVQYWNVALKKEGFRKYKTLYERMVTDPLSSATSVGTLVGAAAIGGLPAIVGAGAFVGLYALGVKIAEAIENDQDQWKGLEDYVVGDKSGKNGLWVISPERAYNPMFATKNSTLFMLNDQITSNAFYHRQNEIIGMNGFEDTMSQYIKPKNAFASMFHTVIPSKFPLIVDYNPNYKKTIFETVTEVINSVRGNYIDPSVSLEVSREIESFINNQKTISELNLSEIFVYNERIFGTLIKDSFVDQNGEKVFVLQRFKDNLEHTKLDIPQTILNTQSDVIKVVKESRKLLNEDFEKRFEFLSEDEQNKVRIDYLTRTNTSLPINTPAFKFINELTLDANNYEKYNRWLLLINKPQRNSDEESELEKLNQYFDERLQTLSLVDFIKKWSIVNDFNFKHPYAQQFVAKSTTPNAKVSLPEYWKVVQHLYDLENDEIFEEVPKDPFTWQMDIMNRLDEEQRKYERVLERYSDDVLRFGDYEKEDERSLTIYQSNIKKYTNLIRSMDFFLHTISSLDVYNKEIKEGIRELEITKDVIKDNLGLLFNQFSSQQDSMISFMYDTILKSWIRDGSINDSYERDVIGQAIGKGIGTTLLNIFTFSFGDIYNESKKIHEKLQRQLAEASAQGLTTMGLVRIQSWLNYVKTLVKSSNIARLVNEVTRFKYLLSNNDMDTLINDETIIRYYQIFVQESIQNRDLDEQNTIQTTREEMRNNPNKVRDLIFGLYENIINLVRSDVNKNQFVFVDTNTNDDEILNAYLLQVLKLNYNFNKSVFEDLSPSKDKSGFKSKFKEYISANNGLNTPYIVDAFEWFENHLENINDTTISDNEVETTNNDLLKQFKLSVFNVVGNGIYEDQIFKTIENGKQTLYEDIKNEFKEKWLLMTKTVNFVNEKSPFIQNTNKQEDPKSLDSSNKVLVALDKLLRVNSEYDSGNPVSSISVSHKITEFKNLVNDLRLDDLINLKNEIMNEINTIVMSLKEQMQNVIYEDTDKSKPTVFIQGYDKENDIARKYQGFENTLISQFIDVSWLKDDKVNEEMKQSILGFVYRFLEGLFVKLDSYSHDLEQYLDQFINPLTKTFDFSNRRNVFDNVNLSIDQFLSFNLNSYSHNERYANESSTRLNHDTSSYDRNPFNHFALFVKSLLKGKKENDDRIKSDATIDHKVAMNGVDNFLIRYNDKFITPLSKFLHDEEHFTSLLTLFHISFVPQQFSTNSIDNKILFDTNNLEDYFINQEKNNVIKYYHDLKTKEVHAKDYYQTVLEHFDHGTVTGTWNLYKFVGQPLISTLFYGDANYIWRRQLQRKSINHIQRAFRWQEGVNIPKERILEFVKKGDATEAIKHFKSYSQQGTKTGKWWSIRNLFSKVRNKFFYTDLDKSVRRNIKNYHYFDEIPWSSNNFKKVVSNFDDISKATLDSIFQGLDESKSLTKVKEFLKSNDKWNARLMNSLKVTKEGKGLKRAFATIKAKAILKIAHVKSLLKGLSKGQKVLKLLQLGLKGVGKAVLGAFKTNPIMFAVSAVLDSVINFFTFDTSVSAGYWSPINSIESENILNEDNMFDFDERIVNWFNNNPNNPLKVKVDHKVHNQYLHHLLENEANIRNEVARLLNLKNDEKKLFDDKTSYAYSYLQQFKNNVYSQIFALDKDVDIENKEIEINRSRNRNTTILYSNDATEEDKSAYTFDEPTNKSQFANVIIRSNVIDFKMDYDEFIKKQNKNVPNYMNLSTINAIGDDSVNEMFVTDNNGMYGAFGGDIRLSVPDLLEGMSSLVIAGSDASSPFKNETKNKELIKKIVEFAPNQSSFNNDPTLLAQIKTHRSNLTNAQLNANKTTRWWSLIPFIGSAIAESQRDGTYSFVLNDKPNIVSFPYLPTNYVHEIIKKTNGNGVNVQSMYGYSMITVQLVRLVNNSLGLKVIQTIYDNSSRSYSYNTNQKVKLDFVNGFNSAYFYDETYLNEHFLKNAVQNIEKQLVDHKEFNVMHFDEEVDLLNESNLENEVNLDAIIKKNLTITHTQFKNNFYIRSLKTRLEKEIIKAIQTTNVRESVFGNFGVYEQLSGIQRQLLKDIEITKIDLIPSYDFNNNVRFIIRYDVKFKNTKFKDVNEPVISFVLNNQIYDFKNQKSFDNSFANVVSLKKIKGIPSTSSQLKTILKDVIVLKEYSSLTPSNYNLEQLHEQSTSVDVTELERRIKQYEQKLKDDYDKEVVDAKYNAISSFLNGSLSEKTKIDREFALNETTQEKDASLNTYINALTLEDRILLENSIRFDVDNIIKPNERFKRSYTENETLYNDEEKLKFLSLELGLHYYQKKTFDTLEDLVNYRNRSTISFDILLTNPFSFKIFTNKQVNLSNGGFVTFKDNFNSQTYNHLNVRGNEVVFAWNLNSQDDQERIYYNEYSENPPEIPYQLTFNLFDSENKQSTFNVNFKLPKLNTTDVQFRQPMHSDLKKIHSAEYINVKLLPFAKNVSNLTLDDINTLIKNKTIDMVFGDDADQMALEYLNSDYNQSLNKEEEVRLYNNQKELNDSTRWLNLIIKNPFKVFENEIDKQSALIQRTYIIRSGNKINELWYEGSKLRTINQKSPFNAIDVVYMFDNNKLMTLENLVPGTQITYFKTKDGNVPDAKSGIIKTLTPNPSNKIHLDFSLGYQDEPYHGLYKISFKVPMNINEQTKEVVYARFNKLIYISNKRTNEVDADIKKEINDYFKSNGVPYFLDEIENDENYQSIRLFTNEHNKTNNKLKTMVLNSMYEDYVFSKNRYLVTTLKYKNIIKNAKEYLSNKNLEHQRHFNHLVLPTIDSLDEYVQRLNSFKKVNDEKIDILKEEVNTLRVQKSDFENSKRDLDNQINKIKEKTTQLRNWLQSLNNNNLSNPISYRQFIQVFENKSYNDYIKLVLKHALDKDILITTKEKFLINVELINKWREFLNQTTPPTPNGSFETMMNRVLFSGNSSFKNPEFANEPYKTTDENESFKIDDLKNANSERDIFINSQTNKVDLIPVWKYLNMLIDLNNKITHFDSNASEEKDKSLFHNAIYRWLEQLNFNKVKTDLNLGDNYIEASGDNQTIEAKLQSNNDHITNKFYIYYDEITKSYLKVDEITNEYNLSFHKFVIFTENGNNYYKEMKKFTINEMFKHVNFKYVFDKEHTNENSPIDAFTIEVEVSRDQTTPQLINLPPFATQSLELKQLLNNDLEKVDTLSDFIRFNKPSYDEHGLYDFNDATKFNQVFAFNQDARINKLHQFISTYLLTYQDDTKDEDVKQLNIQNPNITDFSAISKLMFYLRFKQSFNIRQKLIDSTEYQKNLKKHNLYTLYTAYTNQLTNTFENLFKTELLKLRDQFETITKIDYSTLIQDIVYDLSTKEKEIITLTNLDTNPIHKYFDTLLLGIDNETIISEYLSEKTSHGEFRSNLEYLTWLKDFVNKKKEQKEEWNTTHPNNSKSIDKEQSMINIIEWFVKVEHLLEEIIKINEPTLVTKTTDIESFEFLVNKVNNLISNTKSIKLSQLNELLNITNLVDSNLWLLDENVEFKGFINEISIKENNNYFVIQGLFFNKSKTKRQVVLLKFPFKNQTNDEKIYQPKIEYKIIGNDVITVNQFITETNDTIVWNNQVEWDKSEIAPALYAEFNDDYALIQKDIQGHFVVKNQEQLEENKIFKNKIIDQINGFNSTITLRVFNQLFASPIIRSSTTMDSSLWNQLYNVIELKDEYKKQITTNDEVRVFVLENETYKITIKTLFSDTLSPNNSYTPNMEILNKNTNESLIYNDVNALTKSRNEKIVFDKDKKDVVNIVDSNNFNALEHIIPILLKQKTSVILDGNQFKSFIENNNLEYRSQLSDRDFFKSIDLVDANGNIKPYKYEVSLTNNNFDLDLNQTESLGLSLISFRISIYREFKQKYTSQPMIILINKSTSNFDINKEITPLDERTPKTSLSSVLLNTINHMNNEFLMTNTTYSESEWYVDSNVKNLKQSIKYLLVSSPYMDPRFAYINNEHDSLEDKVKWVYEYLINHIEVPNFDNANEYIKFLNDQQWFSKTPIDATFNNNNEKVNESKEMIKNKVYEYLNLSYTPITNYRDVMFEIDFVDKEDKNKKELIKQNVILKNSSNERVTNIFKELGLDFDGTQKWLNVRVVDNDDQEPTIDLYVSNIKNYFKLEDLLTNKEKQKDRDETNQIILKRINDVNKKISTLIETLNTEVIKETRDDKKVVYKTSLKQETLLPIKIKSLYKKDPEQTILNASNWFSPKQLVFNLKDSSTNHNKLKQLVNAPKTQIYDFVKLSYESLLTQIKSKQPTSNNKIVLNSSEINENEPLDNNHENELFDIRLYEIKELDDVIAYVFEVIFDQTKIKLVNQKIQINFTKNKVHTPFLKKGSINLENINENNKITYTNNSNEVILLENQFDFKNHELYKRSILDQYEYVIVNPNDETQEITPQEEVKDTTKNWIIGFSMIFLGILGIILWVVLKRRRSKNNYKG